MLTIDDVRAANKNAGFHFFDPSSMRFFMSRVSKRVHPLPDGSVLFVTSEQFDYESARLYTVRLANTDGSVGTAPGFSFQQFRNSATAHSHAADVRAAVQEMYQ